MFIIKKIEVAVLPANQAVPTNQLGKVSKMGLEATVPAPEAKYRVFVETSFKDPATGDTITSHAPFINAITLSQLNEIIDGINNL